MLVKVIASDNATEKINDLERKIEVLTRHSYASIFIPHVVLLQDKEKSTAMVLKLTEGVKSALEERKAEMDQAKEKFAVERENEQGWKDEFGEISGLNAFPSNTKPHNHDILHYQSSRPMPTVSMQNTSSTDMNYLNAKL